MCYVLDVLNTISKENKFKLIIDAVVRDMSRSVTETLKLLKTFIDTQKTEHQARVAQFVKVRKYLEMYAKYVSELQTYLRSHGILCNR